MTKELEQSVTCPVCDSTEVETSRSEQAHSLPYTDAFKVQEVHHLCKSCGAEGDFGKENDVAFDIAKKAALADSINRILDGLSRSGISNAHLERALSLPPRTVARWKSGTHSDAAIALLRIVATFPWIAEVAMMGFYRRLADATVVMQAGALLTRYSDPTLVFHTAGSLGPSATYGVNLTQLNVPISFSPQPEFCGLKFTMLPEAKEGVMSMPVGGIYAAG